MVEFTQVLLSLVPWLGMSGAIPTLPHVSMAYKGTLVPLPLLQNIYYLLTEFILSFSPFSI